MKYRSEIDGLRAVAVLPVILFHAGVSVFSGGFVGVDIFFVISGYLITTILIADLERGQFSILTFYERRARRICPALFLVMAACLPFAWAWMGPLELRDFGRSIVSVVFFVSNFVFWREDGYFSAPAELKPLLHTWSLAVEEQYYLFAPVCLFLLWRFGKKALFWATVATALASLALTEWGWRHAPSANFYLTPFRVWELLAGSLCAMRMTWRAPRGNDALGAAGLALILFAIFRFDGKTPFPSLYALAPVGGAALIILYARQGTWTARLLSLPPLVGIGLISYSAYLWHQPLFAFARIRALAAPPEALLLGLAALSLVLAYLSWRFVEQPFRRGPLPWLPGRRVLVASCAVGTVFVALGLYGSLTGGLPERFPIPAPGSREAMLLDTLKGNELGQDCWPDGLKPGAPRKAILCPIFTPENPRRRILVIGDSHAHILLPAFAQIGRTDAVSWMGLASCPPFLGVTVRGAAFGAGVCEPFARQQYETVKAGGYDMVVLVSAWSYYLNSLSEGPPDSASMLPPDSAPPEARPPDGGAPGGPTLAGSKAVFARFIPRTVRAYADLGVTVVLIDQVPEQPAFPQKVLRQAVYLGRSGGVSPEQFEQAVRETSQSVAADTAAHGFASAVLSRLAGANVWVLSFKDLFQQNGVYLWGDRNGSYYFDNNHLSLYGARFVETSLTAALTRIEQATARN